MKFFNLWWSGYLLVATTGNILLQAAHFGTGGARHFGKAHGIIGKSKHVKDEKSTNLSIQQSPSIKDHHSLNSSEALPDTPPFSSTSFGLFDPLSHSTQRQHSSEDSLDYVAMNGAVNRNVVNEDNLVIVSNPYDTVKTDDEKEPMKQANDEQENIAPLLTINLINSAQLSRQDSDESTDPEILLSRSLSSSNELPRTLQERQNDSNCCGMNHGQQKCLKKTLCVIFGAGLIYLLIYLMNLAKELKHIH